MPVLAVLAPSRCAGCDRVGSVLCSLCRTGFVALDGVGCARCGAPAPWPVRRCVECARRRIAFASARAAVVYVGVVRTVMARWKEGGRRDLAAPLAGIAVDVLTRPDVDCLAFVPGDRERGLRRGHVPAEALARALAEHWELDVESLLRRRGSASGRRQTGLRRAERRANVRGLFRAAGGSAPRRVCLVDDVYTTGATASACATELRRAGAARIDVVTLARTVR
jgi:predicted amidophosphoribosyltransferase